MSAATQTAVEVSSPADPEQATEDAEAKAIAQDIPVKNIWLLLLYAFPYLNDERLLPNKRVKWEDPPAEICVLVARLLCREVQLRLRRQLNRDYLPTEAVLTRLRGRIALLTTERRQLLRRGRIACRFHNFTIDTPRNRFVRSALEKMEAQLLRLASDRRLADKMKQHTTDYAKLSRQLSRLMHEMGVLAPAPAPDSPALENFGRHDSVDRPMVELAKLAHALALPTEELAQPPDIPIPEIAHDPVWLRRIFEKAVLGFFSLDAETQNWAAKSDERKWQADPQDSSAGIGDLLPKMKTDIVLTDQQLGKQIVIETKFTRFQSTSQHTGGGPKLRSSHLYQIYAYIMSQAQSAPDDDDRGGTPGETSETALEAEGVLLYPTTSQELDEHATIQQRRFRFLTINLADDSDKITEQLRQIARPPQV